MNLIIKGRPITKKNHQVIKWSFSKKHRYIGQADAYKVYEEIGIVQLRIQLKDEPIETPVNVKCLYYMPTRGKVDLPNLIASTHDILTKSGVIKDDNSKIIVSVDGSRVFYDKENPRVEIEIKNVVNP